MQKLYLKKLYLFTFISYFILKLNYSNTVKFKQS